MPGERKSGAQYEKQRERMDTNFRSTALSVVTIAYLLERLRVSVLDEFLDKKWAGVCMCVCMCVWGGCVRAWEGGREGGRVGGWVGG